MLSFADQKRLKPRRVVAPVTVTVTVTAGGGHCPVRARFWASLWPRTSAHFRPVQHFPNNSNKN